MKDLYSSYKDLPLCIYQIQTKYRDEARPRAGLLRGREFVMKDSYSFDIDDEGCERSYERHREAYIRLFDRLGLPFVIVSAMSGAMGGSASRGVPRADRGRRGHVRALHERAATPPTSRPCACRSADPIPLDGLPAAVVARHAGHADDPTLVDHLNAEPDLRRPDARVDRGGHAEERRRQAAPSRRHASSRWRSACPAIATSTSSGSRRRSARPRCEPFDEADFAANPALVKGYIGPGALGAERHVGHPLPRRPAGSSTARVGHRRRTSRAATCSVSSTAATSPPTA